MASDVTSENPAAPATAVPAAVEDSGKPLIERVPRRTEDALPYPLRFRLAYLALAVVLGAAVGGFVLFMGRPDTNETPFSAWQPTKDGEERWFEIADHVSARYLHPNGTKLVEVRPSPAVIDTANGQGERQRIPISAIIIRGRTSDFSDAEQKVVGDNDTLMFALCGGGEACAIDQGQPSDERGTLLRREALELALYTYAYVDGVDAVVALLPPIPGTDEQGQPAPVRRLVYFRKRDLNDALRLPLGRLLPGRPSLAMPPRVAERVEELVLPHLFEYTVQPGQLGDAVLILARTEA